MDKKIINEIVQLFKSEDWDIVDVLIYSTLWMAFFCLIVIISNLIMLI